MFHYLGLWRGGPSDSARRRIDGDASVTIDADAFHDYCLVMLFKPSGVVLPDIYQDRPIMQVIQLRHF